MVGPDGFLIVFTGVASSFELKVLFTSTLTGVVKILTFPYFKMSVNQWVNTGLCGM